jgi:hypothetical protein
MRPEKDSNSAHNRVLLFIKRSFAEGKFFKAARLRRIRPLFRAKDGRVKDGSSLITRLINTFQWLNFSMQVVGVPSERSIVCVFGPPGACWLRARAGRSRQIGHEL